MKNILFILGITSIFLIACKSTDSQKTTEVETVFQGEKIEGDLYFGWLRIGNLYNKEYSSKEDISYLLDTIKTENMGEDSALLSLYRKLDQEGLMYSPYIEVVIENNVFTTWYMTEEDYEKIKQYKLNNLNSSNKKVHIVADIKKLYQNAYICYKIIDIKLKDKGDFNNSDKTLNGKEYE